MPEAGTDAKSSLRKCIGFESTSVLVCAKGEIAALIVGIIEMPLDWHNWSCRLFAGHSMQRDFRVKHPRLYCPGRNPQNVCGFSEAPSDSGSRHPLTQNRVAKPPRNQARC